VLLPPPPPPYPASSVAHSLPQTRYNRITLFYTSLLLLSFLLYLLPPAISLLLRPYARLLLFIAHNKAVLRELKLILNLLPEVAKILSLEFLIIGIYAWWGTMMFANSSEEGRENFSSWGASVWSLWTLVTTANFPNGEEESSVRAKLVSETNPFPSQL
jgi:hypothetical protein